ncbi:MAG: NFACT RNA binding domain-containing protein [Polyangiales bacterium]
MSTRTRIERVDRPLPTLVALALHHDGRREVLLLSYDPHAFGAALVDERPRGRGVDAIGRKLRLELEGRTLAGLAIARDRLVLSVEAAGERRVLVVGHDRRIPFLALLDGDGERMVAHGQLPDDLAVEPAPGPFDTEALRAIGPTLLARVLAASTEARRKAARDAMRKAIERQRRKIAAIEADAARAESTEGLRADGSAILAALHTMRPGQTELRVPDYASAEGLDRTIALDPAKSPRLVAEALFHKARRLEKGVAIATQRWEASMRDLERLEALRDAIAGAGTSGELEAAIARAEAIGIRIESAEQTAKRRAKPAPRLPFKRYVSIRGWSIWVGRGAADNDELTLRHARPHHLFLHARGVPGSHVIIPVPKGIKADPETVLDAATLAAHFSDARGQTIVEVQTAERRHVHKRRGSAPGAVIVEREKVIPLRLEGDRLARLLSTEGHKGDQDASLPRN